MVLEIGWKRRTSARKYTYVDEGVFYLGCAYPSLWPTSTDILYSALSSPLSHLVLPMDPLIYHLISPVLAVIVKFFIRTSCAITTDACLPFNSHPSRDTYQKDRSELAQPFRVLSSLRMAGNACRSFINRYTCDPLH